MINEVSLITLPLGASNIIFTPLNLNEKYIDELKIKIDNLNQNYVLNSLYYTRISGNVEGLYTARLNDGLNETKSKLHPISLILYEPSLAMPVIVLHLMTCFLRNMF
ncbi:MAG: hypothetical protein IPL97_06805 [Niastella sp.]|nr:hypothetical protein [Niastella sp.]